MRKTQLLFMSAFVPVVIYAQRMTDTPEHSKYIMAVDEFVPAPGQFVNTMPQYEEGDTPADMTDKCTQQLAAGNRGMVSLGAYGGYMTFHFDHSIANIDGRLDFYVMGNAFRSADSEYDGGSSEPGIVMVSKDVNGNGIPDDPWYELSGSCDVDSVGKVDYGYEITYTFDAMNDVPWTDNRGNSGVVSRNSFHVQEYFPQWLGSSLTFSGTRLPDNAVDVAGNGTNWVQMFFRYGYVDNKPNADKEACSFDISWAVDENRKPVNIDFIDFIRVYNGTNQMCGLLGEVSTEVVGAEDLHLDESLSAIRDAQQSASVSSAVTGISPAHEVCRHSTDGCVVMHRHKGVNIVRMSDGSVRKLIVR